MNNKIKWGILGCAKIAVDRFIPALMNSSNSELYAVVSRSAEKVRNLQEEYHFKRAFSSYDELLDDRNIQVVYIPLPNGMHKEWAIKAARKGKHILVEKPFALNYSDSIEIIDECEKNNVKIMEAVMYRYSDRIVKLKEILHSGIIGEVKHIISYFGFNQSKEDDYRLCPELGGGSLYDTGFYTVDFISMITQDYPISITSDAIRQNGIDIAASAILKYRSGIICTINSWFNAYLRRYSEIIGTKGYIEIPNPFYGETFPIKVTTEDGIKEIIPEDKNRYVLEIEDFADAVILDKQPLIGLEETLRNIKIIEGILEAIKTGSQSPIIEINSY